MYCKKKGGSGGTSSGGGGGISVPSGPDPTPSPSGGETGGLLSLGGGGGGGTSVPEVPSNPIVPTYEAPVPVIDTPIAPVAPVMPEPVYSPPVNIMDTAPQNNGGGGGIFDKLPSAGSNSEDEAKLVNQAAFFF